MNSSEQVPKQRERRREAIIGAAHRLISNRVFDEISVDAISSEAGITKATFYAYFKSKEALRQALQGQVADDSHLVARDNRRAIIESALKLFAERGFHATSLEDVAETAGITKGTIYWYFKQKTDLFRAAAEIVSPLVGRLPALRASFDQPPEQVLGAFVRNYIETFDDPRSFQYFRIIVSEAPHDPELAAGITEMALGVVGFLKAYLEHQIKLGNIRDHDIESSARSFMGMLLIYVTAKALFPGLGSGFPEPARYSRDVVDFFLSGLKQADCQELPPSKEPDGRTAEVT
jgi:AcrR family transcriptional regulator